MARPTVPSVTTKGSTASGCRMSWRAAWIRGATAASPASIATTAAPRTAHPGRGNIISSRKRSPAARPSAAIPTTG
jgi:hypothetical protein